MGIITYQLLNFKKFSGQCLSVQLNFFVLTFLLPDNVISVHNLETFALKFILHKTKGATVFAVDIKVCAKANLSTKQILPWF